MIAVAILVGWIVGPAIVRSTARQSTHDQARESWQRVPDVLKAMGVGPGSVVADIGAGPGFFTERLARAVGPRGRVLAVDVNAEALERLRARVQASGLTNVETILGQADNPNLPAGALDAALIVNAYHEMSDTAAMLAHIRAALKPTGRLVIIEPILASRRDAARDVQTRQHEIGAEFVQQDAHAAGFRVVRLEDPFADRPSGDTEYMLVLVPGAPLGAADHRVNSGGAALR